MLEVDCDTERRVEIMLTENGGWIKRNMPRLRDCDKVNRNKNRTVVTDMAVMQLMTLRRAAGLTQVELGKRAGIAGTTICSIETGLRNVNIRNLGRVAKALGCHLVLQVVEDKESAADPAGAENQPRSVIRASRGNGDPVA